MSDEFANHQSGLESPFRHHYQVAASANDLNPRPRTLRCDVAGTATLVDEGGTSLTYNLVAGEVIAGRIVKCTALGGGCVLFAWY
jgi:hypothetical protein